MGGVEREIPLPVEVRERPQQPGPGLTARPPPGVPPYAAPNSEPAGPRGRCASGWPLLVLPAQLSGAGATGGSVPQVSGTSPDRGAGRPDSPLRVRPPPPPSSGTDVAPLATNLLLFLKVTRWETHLCPLHLPPCSRGSLQKSKYLGEIPREGPGSHRPDTPARRACSQPDSRADIGPAGEEGRQVDEAAAAASRPCATGLLCTCRARHQLFNDCKVDFFKNFVC